MLFLFSLALRERVGVRARPAQCGGHHPCRAKVRSIARAINAKLSHRSHSSARRVVSDSIEDSLGASSRLIDGSAFHVRSQALHRQRRRRIAIGTTAAKTKSHCATASRSTCPKKRGHSIPSSMNMAPVSRRSLTLPKSVDPQFGHAASGTNHSCTSSTSDASAELATARTDAASSASAGRTCSCKPPTAVE